MTNTFYILLVLSMVDGSPDLSSMRFETFPECLKQQMVIETATPAFAKCVKQEERID